MDTGPPPDAHDYEASYLTIRFFSFKIIASRLPLSIEVGFGNQMLNVAVYTG